MENLYIITPETPEEIIAVNDLILKMREEKQRIERIQKCKMAISFEISHSISEIGLADTKRIVREIARELRELKE